MASYIITLKGTVRRNVLQLFAPLVLVCCIMGILGSCDAPPVENRSPAADNAKERSSAHSYIPVVSTDTFPANLILESDTLTHGPLTDKPRTLPLAGWNSNIDYDMRKGIRLRGTEGKKPILHQKVTIDPLQYTHLEIRIAVETGERLNVWWSAPADVNETSDSFARILPDGRPHAYLVPLEYGDGIPKRTRIDHITISLPESIGDCTLYEARLVALPPKHPMRLTLDRETMTSTRVEDFDCILPPMGQGAMLSVALGSFNSLAEFQILHETMAQTQILHQHVSRSIGWEQIRVEIPATAKPSKIQFRQEDGYWGSPVIVRPSEDELLPPIILISNDTLRADHLGCYGYDRPTSPNIDAFAKDAVLFTNAFTPEPFTPSSHMTMLTGLEPKHHGVTSNLNLREDVVTVAESLQAAGYFTGSFVGMKWWFLPWRGFAQGFHVHNTPDRYRSVTDTYSIAQNWLERLPSDNFFLFLHNYDAHGKMDFGLPYDANDDRYRLFSSIFNDPPTFPKIEQELLNASNYLVWASEHPTLTDEQIAYTQALYDDCILKIDYAAGNVFDYLRARDLYDSAMIIVTADHGEAFGEHGVFVHNDVYDPTIRVPLLIKFPQQKYAGTMMHELVSLTDLYPTILDSLDIELPGKIDGHSLLRLLKSESPADRHAIFAARTKWRTIRTRTDKLVHDTRENQMKYYQIGRDPGEKINVLAEQAPEVSELRKQLEAYYTPTPGGWQVALHSGGADWKVDFSVASTAAFESAELVASEWEVVDIGIGHDRNFTGSITLNEQLPVDVLVVKTAQDHGDILLRLESPTTFEVQIGDEPASQQARFEAVLSPENGLLRKPVSIPEPSGPYVSIWYEDPQISSPAARNLSEEDIDALKALGYLAD